MNGEAEVNGAKSKVLNTVDCENHLTRWNKNDNLWGVKKSVLERVHQHVIQCIAKSLVQIDRRPWYWSWNFHFPFGCATWVSLWRQEIGDSAGAKY